jgi:hypothetical protein
MLPMCKSIPSLTSDRLGRVILHWQISQQLIHRCLASSDLEMTRKDGFHLRRGGWKARLVCGPLSAVFPLLSALAKMGRSRSQREGGV